MLTKADVEETADGLDGCSDWGYWFTKERQAEGIDLLQTLRDLCRDHLAAMELLTAHGARDPRGMTDRCEYCGVHLDYHPQPHDPECEWVKTQTMLAAWRGKESDDTEH